MVWRCLASKDGRASIGREQALSFRRNTATSHRHYARHVRVSVEHKHFRRK